MESLEEICKRTKRARIEAGFKDAKDMVAALSEQGYNITLDAYYKYEKRTPIKHNLIFPFCKLTNSRSEWLLTGSGQRERPQAQTKEQKIQNMLEEMLNYFGEHNEYNFPDKNIITEVRRKTDQDN